MNPPPELPVVVHGAVEGLLDEAIFRRLAREVGADVGRIYGKEGKDQLRNAIRGYNLAARRAPWLVLVDLDREECAPKLVRNWLPEPSPLMCLRVAVCAAEAWLMADAEAFALFLGISPSKVPFLPESDPAPKKLLLQLARSSNRPEIREDLVPKEASGRRTGPNYVEKLTEFVESYWRPEIAAQNADSLKRCLARLRELVQAG